MNKRLATFIPLVMLLILLHFSAVQNATAYVITDPLNDVMHYQQATLSATGDFHDEIDIIEFEITTNKVIITFENAPTPNADHIYVLAIYWDGDQNSKNYTTAQIGSGTNQVLTYLWDSQNNPIALDVVSDVVTVIGDAIQTPIPSYNLIQNPMDPYFSHAQADFIDIAGSNFYRDVITDDSASSTQNTGMVLSNLILLLPVSISVLIARTNKRNSKKD